jgi:hypothetical protein
MVFEFPQLPDALDKLQKATTSFAKCVRTSAHPEQTTCLPLDVFS